MTFASTPCTDVTAVILAGGRSTRMGRDKATLPIGGTTLFAHIRDRLRERFPLVLIAGDRPDLATADTPCYPDRIPGSPFGGIETGMRHANTPWIFVAPCDLIEPDLPLIDALLAHREDADIIVPRSDNGLEPLFALYRTDSLPLVSAMLDRGEFRILDLYPQVRTRYLGDNELPADWQERLHNLNTPEEYRRACDRSRAPTPSLERPTMLSYDEALALVLKTVPQKSPVELPLSEATGLILAADTQARWDNPSADNSAMDGFAYRWQEGELPPLKIIGTAFAGHLHQEEVPADCAVRITTGGLLPAGTDSVVPIEDVEEQDGTIRLTRPAKRGNHVRKRGEEFTEGEFLLAAGTQLKAGAIALLAAAGVDRVRVHPRLNVAILSTGDELVELGQQPGPGKIINSNSHFLAARLGELGCNCTILGIAGDDQELLAAKMAEGIRHDLFLTTGGVSVGDRDLTQPTLSSLGFERVFWKVAIKPGKPVLFGMANGTPVFGLPGNPAAAAATFELFVRPAIRLMEGNPDPAPVRIRVKVEEEVKPDRKRQQFVWGSIAIRDGQLHFVPANRQGSNQTRCIQGAGALLPVPAGDQPIPAGTFSEAILLRESC